MSLHPLVDKCKVRVADSGFMGASNVSGRESGILEEVPKLEDMLYFGFHSFAFDSSLTDKFGLKDIHEFYSKLVGKVIYWEALQDRGRRFEEDGKEYVILNLTDIVGYDDKDVASAKLIDDVRSGGFRV